MASGASPPEPWETSITPTLTVDWQPLEVIYTITGINSSKLSLSIFFSPAPTSCVLLDEVCVAELK